MTASNLGFSRRALLRAGSLALGGLTLADLLRARAAGAERAAARSDSTPPGSARATSVILLWLEGGPSHLETYDLKPLAPVEFRGEFAPIRTNVPGIELCEHLPRQARIADRFSLVRSITHDVPDHPGAAGRFLTGRRPVNISDPVSKFPTLDVITAKAREERRAGVPNFVSNVRAVKGGGSAYLGAAYEPFVVAGDPNSPDFRIDNLALHPDVAPRLEDRVRLNQTLDTFLRGLDLSGAMQAGDRFQRQALELLTSDRARRAFDLSAEPEPVRERYGRTKWGQSALLARRLVEAGCSFVTVEMGYLSPANATWDDHGDAQHIFKSMRQRLPVYDQALTALVEDLVERGLDRDVLVVATGEFGRTPQVNMGRAARPVFPGRDHWPGAMSVLLAGGGLQMGRVVGATNARGELPQDRPLDPNDLLATLYRFLGIDPTIAYPDHRGRPMPILPSGRPIAELL